MLNLSDLSRLKGFRFPRSVISYAVWAYHRFALSLRDVEDLMASRGISVSYETIRPVAMQAEAASAIAPTTFGILPVSISYSLAGYL